MENRDYKGAIQLFERARAQTRYHTSPTLSAVSLVSILMAILRHVETAHNRLTDIWVEV